MAAIYLQYSDFRKELNIGEVCDDREEKPDLEKRADERMGQVQGAAPPYIQNAKRQIGAHMRAASAQRLRDAENILERMKDYNPYKKNVDPAQERKTPISRDN